MTRLLKIANPHLQGLIEKQTNKYFCPATTQALFEYLLFHIRSTTIPQQVAAHLGLGVIAQKDTNSNNVCFVDSSEVRPEFKTHFAVPDLAHYIYAFIHSPFFGPCSEQQSHNDFKGIYFPKDVAPFWQMVYYGNALRQLHISALPVASFITNFPVAGNNRVTWARWKDGYVYINETQYFDNIPHTVWELHIMGHRPAQEWLHHHCDQALTAADIIQYQRIMTVLGKTAELSDKISRIVLQ